MYVLVHVHVNARGFIYEYVKIHTYIHPHTIFPFVVSTQCHSYLTIKAGFFMKPNFTEFKLRCLIHFPNRLFLFPPPAPHTLRIMPSSEISTFSYCVWTITKGVFYRHNFPGPRCQSQHSLACPRRKWNFHTHLFYKLNMPSIFASFYFTCYP